MATYNEQLQRIWHQHEAENGQVPSTLREAVAWAVSKGLLQAPKFDPLDKLAEDMATARAETRVDQYGRKYRVNHAVRVTKAGVQYTFWADLDHAPRPPL